jgi:hypothetical protein
MDKLDPVHENGNEKQGGRKLKKISHVAEGI